MKFQQIDGPGSVPSYRETQRIAVVGAGISGLTCARVLRLRGYHPVVFDAGDRLGGRCSSRNTRVGWFDDGVQAIHAGTQLVSYAEQRPGELAVTHPWTIPATPAEDEPKGKNRDKDEDETDVTRTLKTIGLVGVPSMRALADAIAQPLDVRLHTSIQQTWRRGNRWMLRDARGDIDEDFQALVLAIPAPLALPLAQEAPGLAAALHRVRYRSRWVLMLGSERPVALAGYGEFEGCPIERIAAMHSKPGRSSIVPQRWFVEADERWSLQHQHDDAETVAELLLDNFCAHARRSVTPSFLCAHQWRHAFVESPATLPGQLECLWDEQEQLGVCGDSVVVSQVDRVYRSGLVLAGRLDDALRSRQARSVVRAPARHACSAVDAQAVHG